ncbi:hypothetical protein ScPMuIL_008926 [Solemya velum]
MIPTTIFLCAFCLVVIVDADDSTYICYNRRQDTIYDCQYGCCGDETGSDYGCCSGLLIPYKVVYYSLIFLGCGIALYFVSIIVTTKVRRKVCSSQVPDLIRNYIVV